MGRGAEEPTGTALRTVSVSKVTSSDLDAGHLDSLETGKLTYPDRLKPEMWAPVALELGIPWRAAEAMHWQLGEADMARRAGVVPFSLAANSGIPPNIATGLAPNHALTPALGMAPHMSGVAGSSQLFPGFSISPTGMQFSSERLGQRAAPLGSGSTEQETGLPVPPPISLVPPPNSMSVPSILPSMAELERGLIASEGTQRYLDRRE